MAKRFCAALLAVLMLITCIVPSAAAGGEAALGAPSTLSSDAEMVEIAASNAAVRAITGNTPQALTGSTTGKTLSTGIYYLTANTTFTNTTVGGHGLSIAAGAVVIIDLNGKTLTATGTKGSTTTGSGAGIYLPSTALLVFIGSGTVNATGGDGSSDGATFGGYYAGYKVDSSDAGNGTITNGKDGGGGARGGSGAGAGIGTSGGAGGAGGETLTKTESSGFWAASNSPETYTGNAGSDGASAVAAGNLYILGSVKVNAVGGGAGKHSSDNTGSKYGNVCVIVTRRNDGTTSFSDWAVTTAGAGAGGGRGGTGKAGAAFGTGGGGGGGGGGATPGTIYSTQINNESPSYMEEDQKYTVYVGAPGYGGKGAENGGNGLAVNKNDMVIQYYSNTSDDPDDARKWSYYAANVSRVTLTPRGNAGAGGNAGADAKESTAIKYSAATTNVNTSNYSTYLSGNYYGINVSLIDNASGTTNAAVAVAGNNAALSGTPHSRTGYTLKGYYTAASGGTKVLNADLSIVSSTVSGYTINGLWNTAANTKLYAQWEANKYTVTLNNYDGNGNSKTLTVTYDAPFPTFDQPEKYGFKLSGYSCLSQGVPSPGYVLDSTGKPVSDYVDMQYFGGVFIENGVWKKAEDRTLYAMWNAETVSVTLNSNGKVDSTISLLYTYQQPYGSPINASVDKYTRAGYTLNGFFTASSGGTKVINANGTQAGDNIEGFTENGVWIRLEKVTLWAQWTKNQYSVALEANGGSGSTINVNAEYDSAFPSFTPHTKTGYALAGYFTSASSGTKVLNADGSIVSNVSEYTGSGVWQRTEGTTLYAQWEPIPFTVTLNGNGGTGGTASVTATYGVAFPSFTRHTKTGYTLTGYFTSASGGTKVLNADGSLVSNVSGYTGNGVWQRTEATTLYAQWIEGVAYLDGSDTNAATGAVGWKSMYSGYANLTELHIDGTLPAGYALTAEGVITNAAGNTITGIDVRENENYGNAPVYLYIDGTKAYIVNGVDLNGMIYVNSCQAIFQGLSSAVTINLSKLDTSRSKDFYRMFQECKALQNLTLPGVFDLAGVQSPTSYGGLSYAFDRCEALERLDLSGITNVPNNYNLSGMFDTATALKEVIMMPGKIQNVRELFQGCTALEMVDFSRTDLGSVGSSGNYYNYVFDGCTALKKIILPTAVNSYAQMPTFPVEMYLPSDMTTGYTALKAASGSNTYMAVRYTIEYQKNSDNASGSMAPVYYLWGQYDKTIHVAPESGFVYDGEYAFAGWKTAAGTAYNVGVSLPENTSLVLSAQWKYARGYLKAMSSNDTTSWRTMQTIAFGIPFGWSISGEQLVDASGGVYAGKNVSAADSAGRVYFYAVGTTGYFINIDLPNADVYTKNAVFLFYDCQSLTGLDFTNAKLNTSECTSFESMFQACGSLKSFTWPSAMDTSNVTSTRSMFNNCTALTTLDISNMNTENVVDMSYMFYNCSMLGTFIQPSVFVTAKVGAGASDSNKIGVRSMFVNCNSLTVLDLSTWDLSGFTYYWGAEGIFGWPNESVMQNLRVLYLPAKVSNTILTNTHFDMLNLYSDSNTHETKLRAASQEGEYLLYRYTVTYDANGGTGTSYQYYLHDIDGTATISLSDGAGISKRYYTLSSWNTTAGADGTSYKLGASHSITNKDIKLYAVWLQNKGDAYLLGGSLGNKNGWRYDWIVSQYNHSPEDDGDDNYLANIAAVYVGQLPDGYYIDENDGFKLKSMIARSSVAYAPLDVSTSTSPVPCYAYTLGEEGSYTVYFVNAFDPSADVYHKVGAAWMFKSLVNATVIDVSKLNTSATTDLSAMFHGCQSLTSVNLSNFDRSVQYTNVWAMFNNCSSLETIDLSGFDFSACDSSESHVNMFSNMNSLKVLILPDKVSSVHETNLGITLYGDDANMTAYTVLPEKNTETGLESIQLRYTVTYKANYDGIADATDYILYGDTYTIRGDRLQRKYYAISSLVDGDNNVYKVGASYSANADLVLTAVWEEKNAGSSNLTIEAHHEEISGKDIAIMSVDISWGAMEFIFTPESQKWNAEKLAYETVSSKWKASGNNIMVTNHSNVDVLANFTFTPTEALGINSFYSYAADQATALTEPARIPTADDTTLDSAPKITVYLNITAGNITHNAKRIGLATVTIRKGE